MNSDSPKEQSPAHCPATALPALRQVLTPGSCTCTSRAPACLQGACRAARKEMPSSIVVPSCCRPVRQSATCRAAHHSSLLVLTNTLLEDVFLALQRNQLPPVERVAHPKELLVTKSREP
eukprot:CAMPEP_0195071944 /NCGR_PEP_ID=MMETSP0448-20130528/15623_1 /TAXON_ID=66468 /ORGANISM="Heterocapsa triquestra, Strain CCMP 448" /LENGTH=119 /DNA_ID=CAMNT_0040103861 /DNA_START=136 /DNA_END=491 /DNA_ORIENTATION=+